MDSLFKLGDVSCNFVLFYVSYKEEYFEPLPQVFTRKIVLDQASKLLYVTNFEDKLHPTAIFYLKGMLQEQYEVTKTIKVIYRRPEEVEDPKVDKDGDGDGEKNEPPKFIVKIFDHLDIEVYHIADIVT